MTLCQRSKVLWDSMCSYISLKTDVIDFDNGFKEDFGTCIMNLAFLGFVSSLGIQ